MASDIRDAQWIAELLQHGLLRASFIPPIEQRDLIRHRSNFIRERVNKRQPSSESAGSCQSQTGCCCHRCYGSIGACDAKCHCCWASRPTSVGRISTHGDYGTSAPQLLQALNGRIKPHHRFIMAELLTQIDSLDETITRFDEEVVRYCTPFESAVQLLDTIPGVARRSAESIVGEIGINMSRFPTAAHLAAWAGVAPGNHESAGKNYSGKTRPGNAALRTDLVQAANAAARTATYLGAQYRRLASRRGRQRAIIAVAHSILVIAYHLIARQETYRDLGANYFDSSRPEATTKRLVKRLEQLGHQVTLQPQKITVVT